MNSNDRAERIRLIMQRRIRAMRDEYGMQWDLRHTQELTRRCIHALGDEGIDDCDLRVLVRLFNREIKGRS